VLHDTALPVLALPATRAHVLSARLVGLRDGVAQVLRRVAGWVEPRPATHSGMIGCQVP
jgi:hypothetical protein